VPAHERISAYEALGTAAEWDLWDLCDLWGRLYKSHQFHSSYRFAALLARKTHRNPRYTSTLPS
jgi:hypothetical protein